MIHLSFNSLCKIRKFHFQQISKRRATISDIQRPIVKRPKQRGKNVEVERDKQTKDPVSKENVESKNNTENFGAEKELKTIWSKPRFKSLPHQPQSYLTGFDRS